jgi:hypothetical protein
MLERVVVGVGVLVQRLRVIRIGGCVVRRVETPDPRVVVAGLEPVEPIVDRVGRRGRERIAGLPGEQPIAQEAA